MATDDFGIVVGITRYGRLTPLEGPELDADAFYAWLIDPAKGNVPTTQVFRVRSSDFRGDQPSMEDVEEKFEELRDAARDFIDHQGRPRRLYIFLAGHGLSWDVNSAALLTANADYNRRRGYHVAGRSFAEWFREAAYFREVVLVMDCCRNEYPGTPPRVAWPSEPDPEKVNVQLFYAFATKGGSEARERVLQPGKPRQGIFTYALLEGLDHADPDAKGQVTGQVLSNYLYTRLGQLADPKYPQEPHVEVFPSRPETIVWANRPQPTRTNVTVRILPAQPGAVEVWTPDLAQKLGTFPAAQPIQLPNLPSGMYNLRWPATFQDQAFEVVGTARAMVVMVSLNAATPEERVTYAYA